VADLSITIEDNQLVIRGKQADDGQRIYLHRGIAARQFQRSFVLAEGIEVRGAWLENGCSMSIWYGRQSRRGCARSPIRGPEPAADSGRPRPLRARLSDNAPPGDNKTRRDVVFYDLRSIRWRAKPSTGATEVEMQYIEGIGSYRHANW